MKIAVITDTNCGLTKAEGEEKGLYIVPMPFNIDGKDYLDSINLTREEFFKLQKNDADISTSQPSPGFITELWDEILKDYEAIIHIPMSSSLSSSCETAIMLSKEDEYAGKVFVVDNKRIAAAQLQSALEAKQLVAEGKTPEEIVEILLKEALDSVAYLSVDSLKYLRKGGRISAAAAALGTLFRIKPVLYLKEGKIEPFAKARTPKQAKDIMIEGTKKELQEKFNDKEAKNVSLSILQADAFEQATQLKNELEKEFPNTGKIRIYELSLSVATHVGVGTVAIMLSNKIQD